MGVGGGSYPISIEVNEALARYPVTRQRLRLRTNGRSSLEAVRILGNLHYPHLQTLWDFIENCLPCAGEIGGKILKAKDLFQFDQALAEVLFFAHIASRLGPRVKSVSVSHDRRTPDLEVGWNVHSVLIEIYSPTDFMGLQLIERSITPIIKYLDIPRGFDVDCELRASETSWYPYSLGDESSVRPWLAKFAACAKTWLEENKPSQVLVIDGLGGRWQVKLTLARPDSDRERRSISRHSQGRSTDTRLFFECGRVEDTAGSQWGKRLKRKLGRRQAGESLPTNLRILIVDFSHADTGWPDFICWPKIAERMDAAVGLIVKQLGGSLPYDVVLPAQLGRDCCFGPMVILDSAKGDWAAEFAKAATLDRPCLPRGGDPFNWDEVLSANG